MAGWTGWEKDLLATIGAPNTAKTRLWLSEWEAAERTPCSDNPLSATVDLTGSTRCKELSGGVYARAYKSHTQGLAATSRQLNEAQFDAIRQALHSGDPFSFTNWQLVVGALGAWGAHVFAGEYAQAMNASAGTPGPPQSVPQASQSLHAYTRFARTLAHTIPASLNRAHKLNAESLARIGK